MITLTELKAKAERKYLRVLQASISGEQLFPLYLATDKNLDKAQGAEYIFAQQQELIAHAKQKTGNGFSLELKENSRTNQSEIRKICFETQDDFIYFVNKEIEFQSFQYDANYIFEELSALKVHVVNRPKTILEAHGKWPNLIKVCRYFINNPRPNLYARSLPIDLPTKFIEQNQGILRILLDYLIPDEIETQENDFFKRHHLLVGEPSISIRFLDVTLSPHPALSQIGILVNELARYVPDCEKVFIIENQASFLSFPELPKSIAIWGGGFAVNLLKDVKWLADKEVCYWGDIDIHGFQILSQIRRFFPNVKSLMMDEATFLKYYKNQKGGNFTISEIVNLTKEESRLYKEIEGNNYRLEQEKIPGKYVIEKLLADLSTLD